MNIELVVIGNEILSGSTINTNAAFIGKTLFESGYKLSRQTVLPDDKQKLQEGIEEALFRSEVVMTTGGLGPTIDDISLEVVERIFEKQPKKIPNPLGTAPGYHFQSEKGVVIMVPGVPYEMEKMVIDEIIPYIKNEFPLKNRPYRRSLYLSGISEMKIDPILRVLNEEHPLIEFGIYPALGQLTVQLTSYISHEELETPLKILEQKFSKHLYRSPLGKIEDAIQTLFIEKGWTLSSAESCTGGEVSAKLTALPGASKYFLGSIISYSNRVKSKVLKVPDEVIKEYGAVSQQVVELMVEGVHHLTGSNFAIAVSGIAGPSGGSDKKPVGTVWFALKRKGKRSITWTIKCSGTRSMIINRSVNELLGALYQYAKE